MCPWLCRSVVTLSSSDRSKLDCYDEGRRSVDKSWKDSLYDKAYSFVSSERFAVDTHAVLQHRTEITKQQGPPPEFPHLPDLFGDTVPIKVHWAQFEKTQLRLIVVDVSGTRVTLQDTFESLGQGAYGSVRKYAEFIERTHTGRMYAIKSTSDDEDVVIERLKDDFCDAVPTRCRRGVDAVPTRCRRVN